ncbi:MULTISPECIES: CDP-glucose 4,6-dehydratase [Chromobacterium]|uniref:CDP-glucose 4,6-dehydratase n=1 Tax=Chromobacterium TaxID=535 RepID=UPI001E449CD8|nr:MULTISPECIES: CDP-glucose 4,6-dehydratase [Chromobacterium]WSE92585.1 CDP-glucose 4,6-dehydratase [Chromobacterium subtsugae]WVH60963.1 CDP-glucose 4,6-dehydratase [Chromobacterium subtsugae]
MAERGGTVEKVVNAAFWSGRRVFLTGHTGFKGGWLSLWLDSLGARVHGYALPPSARPSLFDAARVGDAAASELADIRDSAALSAALARAEPSIVFHLAAQPLVRQSYADPLGTLSTNVMGTANLLEAARRCPGVEAVVVVTTDKCYENHEWPWAYRESDALGGHDPYSSSKACAELVCAAYRSSYPGGAPIATARAGNVIGGGDWSADRLVPDLLQAFAEGRSLAIRSPDAVRPWQHVLESLAGYLRLAERLAAGQPDAASAWNFGPADDSNRPVSWVADTLAGLWGGGGWHRDGADHPHEAGILRLDSAKARRRLGWTPRWSLEEALSATLDWHRAWRRGADMRAFTIEQIAAYSRV